MCTNIIFILGHSLWVTKNHILYRLYLTENKNLPRKNQYKRSKNLTKQPLPTMHLISYMHAIRNYKQSGSTEWSSKNDFESRNFKCKTSRNLSLSLSSQRDRIQHPITLFTHFKTNTKSIAIYRLARCCVLLKNQNIVNVMKWARQTRAQQISINNGHSMYSISLYRYLRVPSKFNFPNACVQ